MTVQGNRIGVGATGAALGNGDNGVRVTGGAIGTQVGGLSVAAGTSPRNIISANDGSGVAVEGAETSGTTVYGNFIGANVGGTAAMPNSGDGVRLRRASATVGPTSGVGANVISGNELAGVFVGGAGASATLGDNLIGLNATGTAAVPNELGVELGTGSSGSSVGSPGNGRTLISGNRQEGVLIHGDSSENVVQDAYIGVRGDGRTAAPNGTGVEISGSAQLNTIGGASTAARNVISGNRGDGVLITGRGASRNTVRGNYIGTWSTGLAAQPNDVGVEIAGGARANTVGGVLDAPLSLISGNTTAGVRITGAGTLNNRVRGNSIGPAANGTSRGANGLGVHVTGGAARTTIGGAAAGQANRVAFNLGDGVLVDGESTAGTDVNRNRIFANGGLGIDLRPLGEALATVTPNDPGDPDAGPNALQNAPVITDAVVRRGTTISGTLNSTPSSSFRIDVYRNPAATPVEETEAQEYVGSASVTTDEAGNANWSLAVPVAYAGAHFRATATNTVTFDTSELSDAVTAAGRS